MSLKVTTLSAFCVIFLSKSWFFAIIFLLSNIKVDNIHQGAVYIVVQISNANGIKSILYCVVQTDMSPPTKELMKLTLELTLAHNGHPVLRWMMDNIFIRRDPAGNIKPDKEKSTEEIDGAVAMIMALDRAIRCGCVSDESVYDSRDMLIL